MVRRRHTIPFFTWNTRQSYPTRPRGDPQQEHEMCSLGNCVPCITPPSPRWGLTLSIAVVNST
nr:MAG TPA: hypothetical protein [Caudoviricetes sp.]